MASRNYARSVRLYLALSLPVSNPPQARTKRAIEVEAIRFSTGGLAHTSQKRCDISPRKSSEIGRATFPLCTVRRLFLRVAIVRAVARAPLRDLWHFADSSSIACLKILFGQKLTPFLVCCLSSLKCVESSAAAIPESLATKRRHGVTAPSPLIFTSSFLSPPTPTPAEEEANSMLVSTKC